MVTESGEEQKRRGNVNRLKFEIRRWRNIAMGTPQKNNQCGQQSRYRKQLLRRDIYISLRQCAAKKIQQFMIWAKGKLVLYKQDSASVLICRLFLRLRERREAERRCGAVEVIRRFLLSTRKGQWDNTGCDKYPYFAGDVVPRLTAEVEKASSKFKIRRNLPGASNLMMFTYTDAGDGRMFEPDNNQLFSNSVLVRMEMRSLVVNKGTGLVQARGLPKFLTPGGPMSRRWTVLKELRSSEVTAKRDGSMVFGVKVGKEMRLWTKGGLTEMAKKAEDWAGFISPRGQDVWGFLRAMECKGCTVTLEYEGRQHAFGRTTSVSGAGEESLIVVAVRMNVSGRYYSHDEMCAAAAPFHVEVVERRRDLEGMGLREIEKAVRHDAGYEGVVVAVEGEPRRFKIKTRWWLRRGPRGVQRVEGLQRENGEDAGDSRADRRRCRLAKKTAQLNTRGQRVALVGLPQVYPPAHLLEEPGVVRVEAFYNRDSGKRGAVIVSFRDPDAAEAVLREGGKGRRWEDVANMEGVTITKAYSGRSCGAGFHRVSTWWSRLGADGGGGGAKKKTSEGGQGWEGYRWRLVRQEAEVVVPRGGVEALHQVARRWKYVLGWEERKLVERLTDELGGEEAILEVDIQRMMEEEKQYEDERRRRQGEKNGRRGGGKRGADY